MEYLPFDELPVTLLEKLEEYPNKNRLMIPPLLDIAGVNVLSVHNWIAEHPSPEMSEWELWKSAVCKVSGQAWHNIAPKIYKDVL